MFRSPALFTLLPFIRSLYGVLSLLLLLSVSEVVKASSSNTTGGDSFHPLCTVPSTGGCGSLQSSQSCLQWSGCVYSERTRRCIPRPGCDETLCGLRNLAIRFAAKLLPSCVRGEQDMCDSEMNRVSKALDLDTECFVKDLYRTNVTENGLFVVEHYVKDLVSNPQAIPSSDENATAEEVIIFIDPVDGNDGNSGLLREEAVKTIEEGLNRIRVQGSLRVDEYNATIGIDKRTIVLMKGKHRLLKPIRLGPKDSNLTIQGETGAIITGAILLDSASPNKTTWSKQPGTANTYFRDLPSDVLAHVGPLSVFSYHGEPAVRARFPNKNSYLDTKFQRGGVSGWKHDNPARFPSFTSTYRVQVLNNTVRYGHFVSATGGPCLRSFQPPTGFFCSPDAQADGACPYSLPTGVSFRSGPAAILGMSKWKRRDTGYFHTLQRLAWGGWIFKIAPKFATPASSTTFSFTEGGFQEARGDCGEGGGDWYVENVRELLDAANEYFLSLDLGRLWFIPPPSVQLLINPSEESDTNDEEFFEVGVANLTSLIEIVGLPGEPVRNVRILNIIFEFSYLAHMEPHETQTGGDWAIHRGGTLFAERVDSLLVADCTFRKLGSTGIFISRYARDVRIERNEMFGLDSSGILLSGDPKFESAEPWDRRFDSDYIADVVIRNNHIHDIGLMEMQSAGIATSICHNILIERNIIYRGPRAGISHNDLYGGNFVTRHNLIFDTVSLTHDHGPYNVWDRQQWFLPQGLDSMPHIVEENFIFGSALGSRIIDLDGGSRNHIVRRNLCAYGYIKLKGSNETAYENTVLAYLPAPYQSFCHWVAEANYPDAGFTYANNTCFASNGRKTPYGWAPKAQTFCSHKDVITRDNRYYGALAPSQKNPASLLFRNCGTASQWLVTLQQDHGSTFDPKLPPPNQIIEHCSNVVGAFNL